MKTKNNKTKNKKGATYALFAIYFLIGGACGLFMVSFLDSNESLGPLHFIILLSAFYLSSFVHVIIHEAGHLVFGLLTGYRFCSFRIMSFMWISENGSVKLKRLKIAGTSGQCLMIPPEMKDGKIPTFLYNLGGSIANTVFSLLFLFLSIFAVPKTSLISGIFAVFFLMGMILALTNGIPMSAGGVDNDGKNALSLSKSKEAMRAFWIQMKLGEMNSKGTRLKDMPDEWFSMPTDEAMKNSLVAAIGVFTCNRELDAMRFESADQLIEKMLSGENAMIGIHKSLLICDKIYTELILGKEREAVKARLTKEQSAFMKQMKNFPSVIRTEYAIALLCENDLSKAEEIKKRFEKTAKKYPYQNDIASERSLIKKTELVSAERKIL